MIMPSQRNSILYHIWHPTPDQIPSRIVFGLLNVIVWVISVICLWLALQWVGKPFPGFLVNERLVVSDFGTFHWTGVRAGLRIPDRIVTANDQPTHSFPELNAMIDQLPIGTTVRYSIERRGGVREVSIPTMRFTWFDLLMTFGVTFVCGLLYLSLGVLVYILKTDTRSSWAFLFASIFLGIYAITSFDVQSTHWGFVRLALLVNAFIPAAFLHLSLVFPEERKVLIRYPFLQIFPYIISLLLIVPVEFIYPDPRFLDIYKFIRFYIFLTLITLLGTTLWTLIKGTSTISRQRAKVILLGAALAFPLPVVGQLVSFYGGTIGGKPVQNNLWALPLLFFPASISYSIIRHNLFDVDVYIKRAVGYGLMTALVALGYFSVQTILQTFVLDPILGDTAEQVYPIVFAILVVFFFHPLQRAVQDLVDRLFFRKEFDYKQTISSMSQALSWLLDQPSIIQKFTETVKQQLFVDMAGVFLLDPSPGKAGWYLGTVGTPGITKQITQYESPLDDPIISLVSHKKTLITKYDVLEDPRYESVRESCGKRFSDLGASLALPLLHGETMTGVLTLGHKQSGHFYSRDDIDLLQTLSAMTAAAIIESREKEQRGALMQLFSKHVSPQVAESLWQQRDQFLEGGRPRSQKLTVTAMFSDLEGFSGVSEKLEPEVLMGWLNTYLETITQLVMEHGGVVDDYFGDGVKVNFGVPVPRISQDEIREDAVNAVNCALALEHEMIRLNAKVKDQGLPQLRMRIGIYTGPVVAGSLGSADRMKYTTMGDTVNIAARLESFDKTLHLPHLVSSPCRILIGDTTWQYLDGHYQTQRVGELSLKGKTTKITAYCVLRRNTDQRGTYRL